MLHLSNKGSKKSYAAKAACFTAGLVAVFASSSVLAVSGPLSCDPTPDLRTKLSTIAPDRTQTNFVMQVIDVPGADGTPTKKYQIQAVGPNGRFFIQGRMLNNCNLNGKVVQFIANNTDSLQIIGTGDIVSNLILSN